MVGLGLTAGVITLALAVMPQLLAAPTTDVPLNNAGFEVGGGRATAAGWTDFSLTPGDDGAAFTEPGGASGGYRLSHWAKRPYQVETFQYLPGIANGTYRLWVSVRSSGDQNAAYVALRNCSDTEPRVSLPATGAWQKISVTGKVTKGECTISMVSDGLANSWANFDDVRLERIGGQHEKPPPPPAPIVGGIALILVGGIIGSSVLIKRRALRPVTALTRAARRLGAGHQWEQVEVRGNDNVAELTHTFNTMAAALMRDDERQRRLVADIAHELRTPLSTVRSYLEALIDGVLPAAPEVFVSLHDEALLQQRIVDDLQDLTLAEAGALTYRTTRLDLPDLLHSCQTALAVKASAIDVQLLVRAAGHTPVLGDGDRLRQVIGNLISNALRYTPAGGSIVMDCYAQDDTAIVAVTDTGTGIAEEDLPHVFDRFWRAEAARGHSSGGTGLGLAIARQIVTDHGGEISVDSELGRGTTFTIRLPLATADSR